MAAGTSRKEIARTLTAAYAGGLLSEDTYVHRLDQLFEERVVEPLRLIGDLSLRAPTRPSMLDALRRVAGALRRIRISFADPDPDSPPVLLALDWDGDERELLVGRHCTCDIVLDDPGVSRLHARLVFRDESWIVQDLASTNGTIVNGARVGRHKLRPGDMLALGGVRLKVD